MHPLRLSAVIAACLLSACAPDAAPSAPAPQPAAPPAPPAPAPMPETVTARYDCPTAGIIEIIRDGRFARLRMTDGRIVNLGVIRGSEPPVWSEVGLRFMTDAAGAELAQENGRTVRCTQEALPAVDETPEA